MKKLAEYRDEEALDLLSDLLEPFSALFKDEEFRREFSRDNYIKAISLALKRHKPELMQIMARMEGVDVKDFHCSIATLPMRLIELMQDATLKEVFTSQV